jgi:hypothetical protein
LPIAFSSATVMIWSSCLEPAAHLELAVRCGLDGRDIFLDGLVGRVGIDPEHELVQRQHRHRRHVLPREGDARGEWRGKKVRERDDQLVGVALGALDVEEALAAGTARLVHDHHGLLHQIVLGDDALDGARHLIGAAAGAGGNDEFNVACRLPGAGRSNPEASRHGGHSRDGNRLPPTRVGHRHIFLPERFFCCLVIYL